VTVLHPGAASPARRWPADRWAALARAERAAGRRVLVTGSAAERALADDVAAAAELPTAAVLAGRTDVAALAAVVAHAGRVVCGDTGVAHLATAYGVPSVVLFGPTPPSEWGPPPARPRHRALHRGGRGDPHGTAPDPRLLEIGVEEVIAALEDVSRADAPEAA
jgi:ADP-heptose:LPS heptosyltransferase